MPAEKAHPSFNRIILAAIILSLLWPFGHAFRPQLAAAAGVVLTPSSSASTSLVAGGLLVEVNTEFRDGDQVIEPETLPGLGQEIAFVEHAARGYTVLLALPPGASAEIAEISGEEITLPAATTLLGAEAAQAAGAPAALIGEPFWLREHWVVRLRVWPVRFDLSNHSVLVMPTISVRLAVSNPTFGLKPARFDPHWEPLYRQVLNNYRLAYKWRRRPPEDAFGLAGPAPLGNPWRIRVETTQPGLYVIEYDDLLGLDLDLAGLDPRTLQLYHQADLIPCQVLGEEDGRFDAGDALVFYAPALQSTYATRDVFWLTTVAGQGTRVPLRQDASYGPYLPTFKDTLHLEEQRVYISDLPAQESVDHWFWTAIQFGRQDTAVKSFPFDLQAVSFGPHTATLRLRALGRAQGEISARVLVNGYEVDAFTVTDRDEALREVSFPHALLQPAGNEVTIELIRGDDDNSLLVDWIEIERIRPYEAAQDHLHFSVDWPGAWQLRLDGFSETPLVWDVSAPLQPEAVVTKSPRRQSGGDLQVEFTSQASSPRIYEAVAAAAMRHPALTRDPERDSLLNPEQQADYLIVAPAEFRAAADRLAAHRAAQGLTPYIADLQSIYDAFNAGVAHPQAIRAFLLYTLSAWRSPAPAFVVLLGDGHYDFQNNVSATEVRVPIYLRGSDPWLGEVADENYLAAVVGEDPAPDIMLGRLPAQTAEEAELLVDKIIAFETQPHDPAWRERLLLVADQPDGAGDFHNLADDIAARTEAELNVQKFYLGGTHNTANDLRRDLLKAWSDEGALFVNYIGHGQPTSWSGDQILNTGHLSGLQNKGAPSILLAMASLTGVFYRPSNQSLQEEMLLLPDGRGLAAYIASTGYGLSAGNSLINEGFLDAVLIDKDERIGAAVLRGKLHLYAQGYDYTEFLVNLFTLFGDPAMALPLESWTATTYLPKVQR